ncbi:hypothetical protein J6590_000911 [Homalodisca vitripennis]|nr:hypothetical protein J6590_000911 [Homalodisca vitripennis]
MFGNLPMTRVVRKRLFESHLEPMIVSKPPVTISCNQSIRAAPANNWRRLNGGRVCLAGGGQKDNRSLVCGARVTQRMCTLARQQSHHACGARSTSWGLHLGVQDRYQIPAPPMAYRNISLKVPTRQIPSHIILPFCLPLHFYLKEVFTSQ